jgi:hypothetical protein
MNLTDEQRNKVILLGRLFSALDVERITKLVEEEEVVSRLKGVTTHSDVLTNLLHDYQGMSVKLAGLQADFTSLKNDFQLLMQAVNRPYEPMNQSTFQLLKSRHGIYC